MLYEYEFTGRKPSNAQVLKQVNEGINQGADMIHISWGENRIEIFKGLAHKPDFLFGSGWIRNISGSDLANHVNKLYNQKFIKEHFQFVHVGG